MLLAYSIDAVGVLTSDTIASLKAQEIAIGRLAFVNQAPGLGLRWDGVEAGLVDGTFVRGYARITRRDHALVLVDALRRLSREFPGVTLHVSPWGDLPMTSLRAGAFELFADAWDAALAELNTPERHRHAS